MGETTLDREATPAYVGRCPHCGAVRSAIVDDPDLRDGWRQQVATFCRETVLDGLTLERTTVGATRTASWDHATTCPEYVEPSTQEELPLSARPGAGKGET